MPAYHDRTKFFSIFLPGCVFRLLQGLGSVAAVELEAGDGRVVADEVLGDAPVAPHHQGQQQRVVQVVDDVVLESHPNLKTRKLPFILALTIETHFRFYCPYGTIFSV